MYLRWTSGVGVVLLSLCVAKADPQDKTWPPPRIDERVDLAEGANGGRVWLSGDRYWKVRDLNTNGSSKEWESRNNTPVQVSVSFLGTKQAVIDKVVFVPAADGADGWPRKVILFSSDDGKKQDKIGDFELPEKPGRHVIDFEDREARYITIRIESTTNKKRARLARIHVLESPKASIVTYSQTLKDDKRSLAGNLLSQPFGGKLERLTSGVSRGNHAALTDGQLQDPHEVFTSAGSGDQEVLYSLIGRLGIATDRLVVNQQGVKEAQRVREIIVNDYSRDAKNPEVIAHFVISSKLDWQVLPLKRQVFGQIGLVMSGVDRRTRISVADLALLEAIRPGESSLLTNSRPRPVEKGDLGINLLSLGLGARVVKGIDYWDKMATANVLHGQGETKGWVGDTKKLPIELIFEVAGGQARNCDRLVFNTGASPLAGLGGYFTRSLDTRNDIRAIQVESAETANGPFERLGIFLLENTDADQVVQFKTRKVRFLKLIVGDNHGGPLSSLRFLRLIEKAAPGKSLLDTIEPNLAHPSLGGAVVRFSSQNRESRFFVSSLLDHDAKSTWKALDASLPQDLVIGFRDQAAALVDTVVLRYPTGRVGFGRSTMPQEVRLAVSNDTAVDGFQTIGFFKLSGNGEDRLQFKAVPARYLLVRITKAAADAPVAISEIAVHEVKRDGYRSILLGAGVATGTGPNDSPTVARQKADEQEREPNNTPESASPLTFGKSLRGTIDPKGEVDHFLIDASDKKGMLTLEMQGEPVLRTSLMIKDESGKTLHRFDPALATSRRTSLSWAVDGGRYRLSVTEPKVSLVLVCDISGSMARDAMKLDKAVNAYVSNVTPQEQVAVIRFDNHVEVLSEFTSEVDLLKQRIKGKIGVRGATALYDAIEKSLGMLSGRAGNRAIVLMTDGSDSGASKALYAKTWERLSRAGVRIYTVSLGAELLDYAPKIANTPRRYLSEISKATGGRHYFTRDSTRLAAIYQEIATELRSASGYVLKPVLSTGQGTLSVVQSREPILGVSAPQRALLIFDCSRSMLGPIQTTSGARRKMDVAREVLKQVVDTLPLETQVGLRVYGNRTPADRQDCKDTELLVRFGRYRRASFKQLLDRLQPNGMTPIAYSLQQVAGDFAGVKGKKLVILVTDGEETCNGDPVAAAKRLIDIGLDVRIHVVGFDIEDDKGAKKQLAGVARAGKGKLFLAKDAAALKKAIQELLRAPFRVEDSLGQTVVQGVIGQDPVKVPTGNYRVRIASQPEIVINDVRIRTNTPTRIELTKQGDKVETEVR